MEKLIKITFPDGMLHAEKNPALSQFVEDLRNKKKYSTEDVATKRVDEKNEVGLPVKNPVNKDNRFEPTKKPTTAFVAGLVVTAFGVRDSMIHIGSIQFGDIQAYSMEAVFEPKSAKDLKDKLNELSKVKDYYFANKQTVEVTGKTTLSSVSLISINEKENFKK